MSRADDLDWNDVRHFLAAVRAGTLAGAAREMGVEHSTVGRRLSAFERALGGSLVLRKPDGLVLTALGERVAAAAEQVERAMAALRDVAVAEQQRVRLAVPSGFAEIFTAKLASLREAGPAIVLELVSSARSVDLQKGEADLAVRGGPVGDPDLVARRLAEVGWSLYASPDYLRQSPIAADTADAADLRGQRVIGFDPALADTPPARWLEAHAAAANIVMRSREMVDMASAAAAGAGVALLPCFLGDLSPALTRLTPQVIVSRELWLVYRREMRLSGAVQAVIRFTIDVMTDASDLLRGSRPGS